LIGSRCRSTRQLVDYTFFRAGRVDWRDATVDFGDNLRLKVARQQVGVSTRGFCAGL
jgi:hypothetical protein